MGAWRGAARGGAAAVPGKRRDGSEGSRSRRDWALAASRDERAPSGERRSALAGAEAGAGAARAARRVPACLEVTAAGGGGAPWSVGGRGRAT